jgi:hypothetical protein
VVESLGQTTSAAERLRHAAGWVACAEAETRRCSTIPGLKPLFPDFVGPSFKVSADVSALANELGGPGMKL